MIDKVQKIKDWISKEQEGLMDAKGNFEYPEHEGAYHILCNLDAYIDSLQEEPVSDELEKVVEEIVDPTVLNAYGVKEIANRLRRTMIEPVSEDLGEYIDKLSKQFPEVSFAKLSRIAVRVAKWQKEKLWKPADGDDLPEYNREVIALLDNGKVVFAHRPPEYWDGKDIVTGKVTRNYPKTYDKGCWNIPNVKYWLDVELPKEMGLWASTRNTKSMQSL